MTPTFLSRFSNDQIQALLGSGQVSSSVDLYGNLSLLSNFPTISSSLLGFPLENLLYNTDYINTFYTTEFTEFTTGTDQSEVSASSATISYLQSQLALSATQLQSAQDALNASLNQNLTVGELQSYVTASMNTVIALRISLGQGSVPSDFQTTYPWNALSSGSI
jgi:hypothetical protein